MLAAAAVAAPSNENAGLLTFGSGDCIVLRRLTDAAHFLDMAAELLLLLFVRLALLALGATATSSVHQAVGWNCMGEHITRLPPTS